MHGLYGYACVMGARQPLRLFASAVWAPLPSFAPRQASLGRLHLRLFPLSFLLLDDPSSQRISHCTHTLHPHHEHHRDSRIQARPRRRRWNGCVVVVVSWCLPACLPAAKDRERHGNGKGGHPTGTTTTLDEADDLGMRVTSGKTTFVKRHLTGEFEKKCECGAPYHIYRKGTALTCWLCPALHPDQTSVSVSCPLQSNARLLARYRCSSSCAPSPPCPSMSA